MKTTEYLNRVKKKLDISSDYALAKAMEVHKARIHDYYAGKAVPDPYACTKIAVLLGVDPAIVMAEIYEETEKNEQRRAFWRDFVLHANKAAAVMLVSSFMLFSGKGAHAGQNAEIHKPPLYEVEIDGSEDPDIVLSSSAVPENHILGRSCEPDCAESHRLFRTLLVAHSNEPDRHDQAF